MSSLDTTMEGDSFVSNTDAIIYPTSDYSGWGGDSMISDPNIVLSSTSTDEYHQQQQVSTAGGGGNDNNLMIDSSSVASSSWFKNNPNNSNKQSEIRIFNVDFRALTDQVAASSSSTQLLQRNIIPQECTPLSRFRTDSVPTDKGSVSHVNSTMAYLDGTSQLPYVTVPKISPNDFLLFDDFI